MSSYDEDLGEKPFVSQEFSKSLILTDLAVSKLESKLSLQRGSTTLNLSDSFIGDEGCAIVAAYLRENIGVNVLELRGNSITPEGLKHLASALRAQNFVRTISLEWNNIGDGLGPLLEALSYSNSLQNLDLRNNRIGPDGAVYISRFLEASPSIARLDLRWNELSLLGGKKILASLSRSRSLKSLELSGNKIPEDLLIQIEQAVKGEGGRNEERFNRTDDKLNKTDERSFVYERPGVRSPDRSAVRSPARSVKEHNYNDELYLKYEAQMINNARNEARINELEILLEQETRRVQDARNELLKDLEAEKARRSYSDENLMFLKEESLKREMEDRRAIQDLDNKLARAINEKNMVYMDLEALQNQYDSLHENSQERIRSLEDRVGQQERQYKQLEESARLSLDRVKKENEQNLYEISRDFQNKLESAEENIRSLKSHKETLESDIRALKNQITAVKAQAQEALSDQEYRIKEEETAKYNNAVRNYEARVKTLEDSRENLNKRLQDVQRELSATEKKAAEQSGSLETSLSQMREEKNDLVNRLQKISAQKDNIANDLYVTKSALDRASIENEDLNRTLKERKEAHIIQLENVCQEHAAERKSLEGNRDLLSEQIKQLEMELTKVRRDRERIIKEHEYLAESLKRGVTSLIQDTVFSHMRKLDSE